MPGRPGRLTERPSPCSPSPVWRRCSASRRPPPPRPRRRLRLHDARPVRPGRERRRPDRLRRRHHRPPRPGGGQPRQLARRPRRLRQHRRRHAQLARGRPARPGAPAHRHAERRGCDDFDLDVPVEGTYRVELTATKDGVSTITTVPVVVQDWLIVSLGDSYGSGEGVPDKEIPQDEYEEFLQAWRDFDTKIRRVATIEADLEPLRPADGAVAARTPTSTTRTACRSRTRRPTTTGTRSSAPRCSATAPTALRTIDPGGRQLGITIVGETLRRRRPRRRRLHDGLEQTRRGRPPGRRDHRRASTPPPGRTSGATARPTPARRRRPSSSSRPTRAPR